MTIYDFIVSNELTAYWNGMQADREPFIGEELFPPKKKLGLDLKWIKGSKGLPAVLKPSAFDTTAIPRARIGFEKFTASMPFFKESMYVDEELRQELNKVIESQNQAYIDMIIKNIFDDEMTLLEGASAQRERMRMQLLSTGSIALQGNGQSYDYDYGMPAEHKKTVSKSWSDPTATIIADIKEGIKKIEDDTGFKVTRAMCSSKVFGYFRLNNEIKSSIMVLTNGAGFVSDNKVKAFLQDELELEIVTNDKRYKDEKGQIQRYIADDVFILFPSGELGNTWFGTTPEESDLMGGQVANVSITDVGVAVTTMQKADPVNVETKVTQICLPDFPTADRVYIIDTTI